MIKPPIDLQDLRRRLYMKAKTERSWRFWGLYVHICKLDTLKEAYRLAKKNGGAPGVDGVTFDDIEASGVEQFLMQLRTELISESYLPMRGRRMEIPNLEPIFEADFRPGSYGYRPQRTAHQALKVVEKAIVRGKTRVIDVDLRAYFDNVRHHLLLGKVAERVSDPKVMHLLKLMLKSTGKRGVPQGGVISPLMSNLYLNEVDKMLDRAKATPRTYCHRASSRPARVRWCEARSILPQPPDVLALGPSARSDRAALRGAHASDRNDEAGPGLLFAAVWWLVRSKETGR